MTPRTFARLLTGATLVTLATTACSGGPTPGPDGSTPAPTTTVAGGEGVLGTVGPTTPDPAATDPAGPDPTVTAAPGERMPASWQSCDNPAAGYSVGYPGDWYTATLDGQYACTFFDPEPFTIPPGSEFPRVALNATQTGETMRAYRNYLTNPEYFTVLRNEDVTVLGRPAVRFEVVVVGLLLEPEGSRWYGYLIDNGGGDAFALYTKAEPDEFRYDQWKAVVDIARDSVRFLH